MVRKESNGCTDRRDIVVHTYRVMCIDLALWELSLETKIQRNSISLYVVKLRTKMVDENIFAKQANKRQLTKL